MTKMIQAPTQGRVVLFDASTLRPGVKPGNLIVPATVHAVVFQDQVTLWAVDDDGVILAGLGGGLPIASFGELRDGVPAAGCWCYPARSDAQVSVRSAAQLDIPPGSLMGGSRTDDLAMDRRARADFDPEETLDPAHP